MCPLGPNVAPVLFLSLVFVTKQRPRPTACVTVENFKSRLVVDACASLGTYMCTRS